MKTDRALTYGFVTAWNTTRLYTDFGQRIAVWNVYEGERLVAHFMQDYDRGIDYHFNPIPGQSWNANAVRTYVMESYDFGKNVNFEFFFRPTHLKQPRDFPLWVPRYL